MAKIALTKHPNNRAHNQQISNKHKTIKIALKTKVNNDNNNNNSKNKTKIQANNGLR